MNFHVEMWVQFDRNLIWWDLICQHVCVCVFFLNYFDVYIIYECVYLFGTVKNLQLFQYFLQSYFDKNKLLFAISVFLVRIFFYDQFSQLAKNYESSKPFSNVDFKIKI